MNKLLIVLAVTAIGIMSTTQVFAQDDMPEHQRVISKIATRFNLNESDIQAVFDEHHQEHTQHHTHRMEERLSHLVEQGSLTSEQKDALLQKFQERESHHSFHEEMKAWAKTEGINLGEIMPVKMKLHHHDMMNQ